MAHTNRLSFDDLVLFERVAATGSFSAAGAAVGLSPSAVSRAISRLEDKVGVPLLRRSTRLLTLTPEGEILLDGTPDVLASLTALEAELGERRRIVKGALRVSVSTSVAEARLVPKLPLFMAAYPEVVLDLNVTDRRVEFLRDRMDIAIRTGPLADTALMAKRIGSGRRVVCASPDYLSRYGIPTAPEDLANHRCLVFAGFEELRRWPVERAGEIATVAVEPAMQSDSASALLRMALAGLGLVRLADFVVGEAISQGRLVPVLEGVHRAEAFPIWAVFAPAERMPLRIRAFLDFLTREVF